MGLILAKIRNEDNHFGMDGVYMREWYYCSIVCTSKKDIQNVEVKIDHVKKGALGFREKIDKRCVSSIHFMFFLCYLSYGNSPQ